jgi:hypothetical protein
MPPSPLVTQSQDTFAVGDHSHIDVIVDETQLFVDLTAIRVAQEQPERPTVDVTELLARHADRRRVQHREHLGEGLPANA